MILIKTNLFYNNNKLIHKYSRNNNKTKNSKKMNKNTEMINKDSSCKNSRPFIKINNQNQINNTQITLTRINTTANKIIKNIRDLTIFYHALNKNNEKKLFNLD